MGSSSSNKSTSFGCPNSVFFCSLLAIFRDKNINQHCFMKSYRFPPSIFKVSLTKNSNQHRFMRLYRLPLSIFEISLVIGSTLKFSDSNSWLEWMMMFFLCLFISHTHEVIYIYIYQYYQFSLCSQNSITNAQQQVSLFCFVFETDLKLIEDHFRSIWQFHNSEFNSFPFYLLRFSYELEVF